MIITLKQFYYLMRLHKPIGIFLLLWPTLWAIWLASNDKPDLKIVLVFISGVIIMRSAGCVINDYADRNFDKYVARTKDRPLTSGKITDTQALILFVLLLFLASTLLFFLNKFTFILAIIGALLTILYPFLKRLTQLPQVGLGFAFSWGIPMAFAAIQNTIPADAWLLFLSACIWPVIYDTVYAMMDKEDDLAIGIKSTALLFGSYHHELLGLLQLCFVTLLLLVGHQFHLSNFYFVSILVVIVLFIYQQYLIYQHKFFKAFSNNNLVGLIIFLGILL